MTYSILVRDPSSGEMGVATQSQAFAVGSSVPWALPGYGVIATQSMGEPMYGELGLDLLRSGLTAPEALVALRHIDPYPERRQVAMIDGEGNVGVYTGEACVPAAGHQEGEDAVALANMVQSPAVWQAMVETCDARSGSLATRLMSALHAAEQAGGDYRGRRSAAILVVRATRTGRPWRDHVVDLRVDDDDDPLARLDVAVARSERYHVAVEALGEAMDGDPATGLAMISAEPDPDPATDPDIAMWTALVHALADRGDSARSLMTTLAAHAPAFVETAHRFADVGLFDDADRLRALLPPRPEQAGGTHDKPPGRAANPEVDEVDDRG